MVASDLYLNFKRSWTAYRRAVDRVLQRYEAGAVNEAIDLYRTTSQPAYDSASDTLDHVSRLNVSSETAASDQADPAYRNSRLLIVVAMTVAAILVVIAVAYLRRFVSTANKRTIKLVSCAWHGRRHPIGLGDSHGRDLSTTS